ncbi:hypothetical protein quinque_015797 [Culex quinquefasciatus]
MKLSTLPNWCQVPATTSTADPGELAELRAHFSNLTAATQATLVDVLEQRKPEVARFLISEVNAKAHPLIATVALNCRGKDQRLQQVRFEMDRARLGEMIRLLERWAEVGGG